jgi:hypothetical protein
LNKRDLSERDICSKFISPAVQHSGWDPMLQIREEVSFTNGRIIVRGKLVTRGKAKRADYILYYKPNIPIAIIEAKDNNHSVGDGMQQALGYATTLNIPFVFSSNGDGFLTCAIRHMREHYVKRVPDEKAMQEGLHGVEKKQLPHMLCVTNMLLHGIENPSFVRRDNTLARPYISYLVRVRTSTKHLKTRYLVLALQSRVVRDQIEIPIRTTVGLKNVNATELSCLTIPLPPLAEQHRIVAKVDELMTLCDQLEDRLTTAQTESSRLLESILHNALNADTSEAISQVMA